MPAFNVFYAHRRDDDDINDHMHDVRVYMQNALPEYVVTVIAGRDDYAENARRVGGWQAWGKFVAEGTYYGGSEPRYHAVVVPNEIVGRATADIVSTAIHAGKRAFFVPKSSTIFYRIHDVAPYTGTDGWKNAAVVLYGPRL